MIVNVLMVVFGIAFLETFSREADALARQTMPLQW